VSGVEIVNCSNVTLVVHERTPSISIDSSHTVRITINEQHMECEIVSSKASQVTISYEKQDGNESKAFTVGEQLITKWNASKGKFETAIYDKFL
jgi:DNA-dependent RNA polymerase auxiliary subunit epsilon